MKAAGEILSLIPRGYRARGAGVAATVVIRALLDFAGLAAMVPVLVIALDPSKAEGNAWAEWLYSITGERLFAPAVCAAAVGFIIAKNVATVGLGVFQTRYATSLYGHYSALLFENYFRRGLLFVKSSNSADIAHKINGVCFAFSQGVLIPALTMAGDAILALLVWTALVVYAPGPSAVMGAAMALMIWGYSAAVNHRMERYGAAENEAKRAQGRLVSETFRGYAEVEVSNAFGWLRSRFTQGLTSIARLRERTETIMRVPAGIIEACMIAGMAVVVLLGDAGGRSTGVTFGIFAVAALRMIPAVRSLVNGWTQIRACLYAVPVIKEAQEGRAQNDEADGAAPLVFKKEIRLDGVTFGFPGATGSPVIDNLSLSIKKGEKIGIRGASGAGKTTLFNLLLGLYEPDSGAVTVDGAALCSSNKSSWHALSGYVPQDVFIADASLAENVAFGVRPADVDRGRVEEALVRASLGEMVAELPQGIDTRIGEGGSRLSGGQRQRVGIARALYKKAEVLFFDEATSSLDSATEKGITAAISALSSGDANLTVIVISHRESSLAFCDRIITLE